MLKESRRARLERLTRDESKEKGLVERQVAHSP